MPGFLIGVQDQYIAAYGGLRFMEFAQNDEVIVNKVEIDEAVTRRLNENTMLFFTGITRQSQTILNEQKDKIRQRSSVLDEMKQIAYIARHQLQTGNLDCIGELLHESWLLKKQLASRVSNGAIDEMYAVARRAGAIGGKVAGAGGGGFLILYCPHEKQDAVRRELCHLRELPFKLEKDGSKVIFNYQR